MGIHLHRVQFLTNLSIIFIIFIFQFCFLYFFSRPPIEEKSELEKSTEVFSINFAKGKTYKRVQGAKLQVFLCTKKITDRSPLRFLGKCAGRNLISAWPLYPFDDAIGQMIELLLLGNSFSPGFGYSLRGRKILGY